MEMTEHTWRLSDPGMDLLERAGLAGLYMSLQAATVAGKDLSPLQWAEPDLTADSVTVRWSGPAKVAFTKLIDWAWQVRDGVLYFPAVHDGLDAANWHLRVPMHTGVMRTFLQHTNVQPKGAPVTRIVRVDEDKEIQVTFVPPIIREAKPKGPESPGKVEEPVKPKSGEPRKLLKPQKDIGELFDQRGTFRGEPIKLSNWIQPGISGRYGDEPSWFGQPDRALLLMLAPTICLYLRLQGQGDNWVIAAPDVRNLRELADVRRDVHLQPEYVDVASLGDAGLKFLAEFSTREPRRQFQSACRVIAIGVARYFHASNRIRKAILDVSDRLSSVKRYRILHGIFPNHFQRRKADPGARADPPKKRRGKQKPEKPAEETPQGNGWYKLPTGRGRIADNLVNGRPWYSDLFVPLPWDEDELERQRQFFKTRDNKSYSRETTWFLSLSMQRTKLMKLITDDDMWDAEAEKVFVQVIWETLDSLYAQEAEATKRGGSRTAADRFEHLNEEIRRSLVQAKTRTLLRGVLAGLLARAGRQKSICAHPPAVWRLIDHPEHWQQGRDLALLALASHRKKAVREGKEQGTDTEPVTSQKGG